MAAEQQIRALFCDISAAPVSLEYRACSLEPAEVVQGRLARGLGRTGLRCDLYNSRHWRRMRLLQHRQLPPPTPWIVMRQIMRLEVVAEGDKWVVREQGIGRLTLHADKITAIKAARAEAAAHAPCELTIRDNNRGIEHQETFERLPTSS